MAAFHVFVERPTDNTPEGIQRLAEAIGKHYGLPSQGLLERLRQGRFRVKGNADKATADLYVRDLELLGAVCSIEESTPENAQKITPMPFPAVRPATPVAGVPTVPPARQSQPSILPPSTRPSTSPSASGLTSGLSAAFSGEQPAADLGALGGGDIPLSLASVDGTDAQGGPAEASFEPPAAGLPASIGPAPEKKQPAKKAKPKDEPLDLFAPPEQQGEEFQVKIAADEVETSARKRASTPPPVETDAAQPPSRKSQPAMQAPTRASQPSLATPSGGVAVVGGTSKLGPLANERVRFVAGVVLAVLLGFVPAHLIASSREKDAYAEIDRKVVHAQQQADTPDAYATLDKTRADFLDRKESERRSAAIIALVIWAAVGGAIAFAWFKKIPWDSLE